MRLRPEPHVRRGRARPDQDDDAWTQGGLVLQAGSLGERQNLLLGGAVLDLPLELCGHGILEEGLEPA